MPAIMEDPKDIVAYWSPFVRRDIAEAVYLWAVDVLDYFGRGRWRYDQAANEWQAVAAIEIERFRWERHGRVIELRVPEGPYLGPEGLCDAVDRVADCISNVLNNLEIEDFAMQFLRLMVARRSF